MTKDIERLKRFRRVQIAWPKAEAEGDVKFFSDAACTEELKRFPHPETGRKMIFEFWVKNMTSERTFTGIVLESEDPEVYLTPSATFVEPQGTIKITAVFTAKFVAEANPPGMFTVFYG